MQKVLVTGGNAGIGLALCKQLVIDHGCHVYLGSRNEQRGQAAIEELKKDLPADTTGKIELIVVDVGNDTSVLQAAEVMKANLGTDKLYALVNNAGVGPKDDNPDTIINTNFYGVKRMIDAFVDLIDDSGRIVMTGSGAGPGYVNKCPPEVQKLLCSPPNNFDEIKSWVNKSDDGKSGLGSEADAMSGYGLSKALLHSYTMLLGRELPKLKISACSPGFINTKLTAGWGASKQPEEGTLAIKKLLFEELQGNGWYYGSDGIRSPYHFMRNPGEPEYDGIPPY